jgi:(2R)-3-sulfolactate dehydrogenase (NADP+)
MASLHLATGAPLRSGQVFVALDPAAIVGLDSYLERAEALVEALQAEDGVRLPGARRAALRAESLREGIEIEERVYRELERLATR